MFTHESNNHLVIVTGGAVRRLMRCEHFCSAGLSTDDKCCICRSAHLGLDVCEMCVHSR